MSMYVIDFSEPKWLINYYHLIGFLSVLLNSLGIYLLQFHCEKLGSFRYWLLSYQLTCFATDVHFTFLCQPVLLFPLFSAYTVGYLSEWFNVPMFYSIVIIYNLSGLQFLLLVLSFVKKHRTLATLTNGFKFPKFMDPVYFSLYIISFICAEVVLDSVRLSPNEQLEYIRKTTPEYLADFQVLKNFELFVKSQTVYYLLYFLFSIGAVVIAPITFSVLAIFRTMHHLKQKISPATYRKHSEAIKCLVVQITTMSSAMAPLLLLGAALMLEYEYAQLLGGLCLAWFSSHSSLNVVSLLMFFPPFKAYLKEQSTRFLSKQNKVKEKISTVTVRLP